MAKVLIIYYSRSGNTKKMAELIADGVKKEKGEAAVKDDSVRFHGRLEGKIGAAFASSGNLAGGNETTILDILNAFLIHGMIIQGDPQGDHYGPVAIGSPDARTTKECIRLGGRLVKLAKRIAE